MTRPLLRQPGRGTGQPRSPGPIGRVVDLEPQPGQTLQNPSTNGRTALTDSGREHRRVHSPDTDCQSAGRAGDAIDKIVHGQTRRRCIRRTGRGSRSGAPPADKGHREWRTDLPPPDGRDGTMCRNMPPAARRETASIRAIVGRLIGTGWVKSGPPCTTRCPNAVTPFGMGTRSKASPSIFPPLRRRSVGSVA